MAHLFHENLLDSVVCPLIQAPVSAVVLFCYSEVFADVFHTDVFSISSTFDCRGSRDVSALQTFPAAVRLSLSNRSKKMCLKRAPINVDTGLTVYSL